MMSDPTASATAWTASAPLPQPTKPQGNTLIYAGKWILADLFSTLFFVALFAATHDVVIAVGAGMAAGVAQIAYLRRRGRPIDAMQWMSLGLVLVFGCASLATHDPRFVMFKATIVYAAVGTVMLKPGWMARYMPPIALAWGADVIASFGRLWAGMMYLTGLANFVLVVHGDLKLWGIFVGVFPLASKLSLFGIQYIVTRTVVRGRIRNAARFDASPRAVAGG